MRAACSTVFRTLAAAIASAAVPYSIAAAEPGEPSAMRRGTVYDVPGTGPVTLGDFTVKVIVQSNGSFARIVNRLTQRVSWMEIPGFYGAPLTIIAFSRNKILILGYRSSSVRGADILDIPDHKIIDSFLLRDYSLSPDQQQLALTRAVIPHYEDEAMGSEVAAVYDLRTIPSANHIERVIGSPDYDVGTRIYPSRAESNAVGSAPSPIGVYSHLTRYEWSGDSQSFAFLSLYRRMSGIEGQQTVDGSEVRLIDAHHLGNHWGVRQKLLERCGHSDDTCGSSFIKLSFHETGIEVDSRSSSSHNVQVIGLDAMSPVPLE